MRNFMEKDYEIAVVVPVYNAKNYLKKAVMSVLNQRYKKSRLFLWMMDLQMVHPTCAMNLHANMLQLQHFTKKMVACQQLEIME